MRTVLVIELKFGIETSYNSLNRELAQLILKYTTSFGKTAKHANGTFFLDITVTTYKVLYDGPIIRVPVGQICHFIQKITNDYV